MHSIDRAIELLNQVDDECDGLPENETYAYALQAAGLLAPDLQIIRTLDEPIGHDPDTLFMNQWGDLFDVDNVHSGIDREEDKDYYFPCVLLITGSRVRAACEVLGEANE